MATLLEECSKEEQLSLALFVGKRKQWKGNFIKK
jgi:hypothetical protein